MWSRRLLVAFIGLLAGIFDVAISGWLPGNAIAIRALLPLVVLLATFSSLERTFTAAVVGGIVSDAFLPSAGALTVRLLIIGFLVHAVAQRYVTNRSLTGSLALGMFGLLLDRMLRALFLVLRNGVGIPSIPEVRASWIAEGGWMLLVMAATFLLFAAFTRRFMPLVSRR